MRPRGDAERVAERVLRVVTDHRGDLLDGGAAAAGLPFGKSGDPRVDMVRVFARAARGLEQTKSDYFFPASSFFRSSLNCSRTFFTFGRATARMYPLKGFALA